MPLDYFINLGLNYDKNLKIAYRGGKFKLPTKINADIPLMRLIGYFISEGCIDKDDHNGKNRYSVRFSFNKNEKYFILETRELLKSIFGIRSSTYLKDNALVISSQSRMLCIFLKDILGLGTCANDKRIPSIVYSLDKYHIGNLLDTYFLGDGAFSKHSLVNSLTISANSASEELIKDIQFLLLRFGVTSAIYISRRGKEKIGNRKLESSYGYRWNLRLHLGYNIIKLANYLPIIKRRNKKLLSLMRGKWPSLFERKDHKFNDELALSKVVKIDHSKTCSEWYDFKIQSDKKPNMNFLHDCGIFSHNCGAKLFKKKPIEKVLNELGITQWAFDIDLLYRLKKNGFKVLEIPTEWHDQKDSKLKIGKTSLEMFLAIIRLRLVYSPFKFIVIFYNKAYDLFVK